VHRSVLGSGTRKAYVIVRHHKDLRISDKTFFYITLFLNYICLKHKEYGTKEFNLV
jgi:hypothetical protein